MQFVKTDIADVLLVEPELRADERGFFARLNCVAEFAAAGLDFRPQQTSLSRNPVPHTLRGMHFCLEPEAKLVRCVRGRMLDVIFDIRPRSATRGRALAVELDYAGARGLYVPPGVAHGFLTLDADVDVIYEIDRVYRPGFDAGLRWNDPAFAFEWPATPAVISARDATYPDFRFPA